MRPRGNHRGSPGSDSVSFTASDPSDVTPPIAALDHTDCMDVTDVTRITGAVSDAGPVYFGLYVKESGNPRWTALASGRSESGSKSGEPGVLDPTMMRNGVYEIILYARDINGNDALSQGCILVDGGMKIGVVDIPAQDMSRPAHSRQAKHGAAGYLNFLGFGKEHTRKFQIPNLKFQTKTRGNLLIYME